jgi:AraC-like DNA-binding protein
MPTEKYGEQPVNASQRDASQRGSAQRITMLFMELLERQFPVDDTHPRVGLRSASDLAFLLKVHVNHLNRAVKEASLKTTSQVIAERLVQEAKILLKHSGGNVAEIAYTLCFTEATHFNNFLKKHTQMSPSRFRKG